MATLAHTSTVSFAGTPLGQLVQFTAGGGSAVTGDVTGVDAQISGVGANSRLMKQVDALAIEPGTADVRLLGMPSFSPLQIGQKGSLAITTPGGTRVGEAILMSYEVEGSVGDLLRGSATFQFTGA